MKRLYSFLSILFFLSLPLTACTALLPQSSAPEEAAAPSNAPASGVVVEEVFEQVVVSQSGGEAGPVTVEIIGGDEAALREFVARQVTYPGSETDHIRVYLGSLPPELPYSLPLPEDARVIGSVHQMKWDILQVIQETPLSPDEVQLFYAQALPEAGWQLAEESHGGGFVSDDFGEPYCQGEERFLSISVGELPDGKTDLRVYVQSAEGYSPCAPDEGMYDDPISELIPALKNPPGTRMSYSGGGGGSSDRDAYNETHLEGDVSAFEAAVHYNDQLAAAGWTLVESGSADGLGWSTWTLTDADGDAWTGTLLVSDIPPGSGKLFAYVRVERTP